MESQVVLQAKTKSKFFQLSFAAGGGPRRQRHPRQTRGEPRRPRGRVLRLVQEATHPGTRFSTKHLA